MNKWSFVNRCIYVLQIVFGAVYLYGAEKNNFWIRLITKPMPILFLLPLLISFWERELSEFPIHTSEPKYIRKWIMMGVISGAFGDFFLVYTNVVCKILGGIAFVLGHVFYLIAIFPRKDRPPLSVFIIFILCDVMSSVNIFLINYSCLKSPLIYGIGIIGYLSLEGFVVVCMATAPRTKDRCPTCQNLGIFGGFMFFFSDIVLVIHAISPNPVKFRNYVVMIQYYIGQFFIAYSSRQWMCAACKEESSHTDASITNQSCIHKTHLKYPQNLISSETNEAQHLLNAH
ncbi:putative YhhN family [Monocercomonoides exilis]|uniref:putative YhhN family n=1 Tax=Monocercomonoides exilis TaxID=2049356 RepID=UPI00355A613E|nr:putative YhhN family [Monocercomonoides exilis]|eukprot:MONOS_4450.1-p1 / transcript=MONOS_4450.1 / gene=MONOS_4450 / organism=Monocercomonoides_exilis_PA203 / gene_product=unspecified product / transcript_product=unspecified product / location=Mono_scaffold00118:56455-57654(+) / protein_length=286 / sequence_SO=supercontig / SO=protein_coding / is_pseudo=false